METLKVQILEIEEQTLHVVIKIQVTICLENDESKSKVFTCKISYNKLEKYQPNKYDMILNDVWKYVKPSVKLWVEETKFIDGLKKYTGTLYNPIQAVQRQRRRRWWWF